MKKYLNKALLYKEWKNIWWFILPLTVLNIKALEMRNIVDYAKKYLGNYYEGIQIFFGFDNNSQIYVSVLIIIIMSYFIISRDRLGSVKNLLNYMPFNKNERMFAKVIVGIGIIFTAGIVGVLINSITFLGNYMYLKRIIKLKYIIGFFIITFLVLSILYIILIGVQCLCKNGIFAVLLGVSVIKFSSSIEIITDAVTVKKFGEGAANMADKLIDNLYILNYFKIHARTQSIGGKVYVLSEEIVPNIIKLIIFLIIVGIILIHIIKKLDINENIMFKTTIKKEIVFRVFSSIFIGFFAADGISRLIGCDIVMYIFILNMIFIIACYFAYGCIDRFIKLSRYGCGE